MDRLNMRGKRILAEIARKLAMLAIIVFVISLWWGSWLYTIPCGIAMLAMMVIATRATWHEFTLTTRR